MSSLAITTVRTAGYRPGPWSSGAAKSLVAAVDRVRVAIGGSCTDNIDHLDETQLADAGIDRFAIRPRKPSVPIERG